MESYTLAQPAPTPTEPPPTTENQVPPGRKIPKALLIGGVILGFIIFFFLGILVSGAGKKPATKDTNAVPTEIPTVTPRAVPSSGTPAPAANIQYLPGKPYYDDSVAILTKTEPRQVLLVSVSRFGQDRGFTQYAKVNYFTGSAWLRDNVTSSISSAKIVGNPLVKRLSLAPTTQASPQSSNGFEVTIENKKLTFSTQKLSYDISAFAFQGYTKINYFGEGKLKTADDEIDAYVLYTQTFSQNASDVSFLSTPEKLTSDWLVFWDEQGNAFYLDNLSSTDKTDPFENYRLGIIVFSDGSTLKLQNPQVHAFGQNNQYNATFPYPDKSLQLTYAISNILNKSTVKTYNWQTGIITGTAQTTSQTKTNGAGIIEMIHKNYLL